MRGTRPERGTGSQLTAMDAPRTDEEKYRTLFEHAQVGMFRSRIDGTGFVDVNRKICEILEGSLEEILQLESSDVWANPADRDGLMKDLRESGVSELETQIRTIRGNPKWVRATFILRGELGCVEGTVIDVASRVAVAESPLA
jgi:PAS domain S-box-containing protein